MSAASRSRKAALAVTVAVGALALAGCSTPTDDPASEIVRTTTRVAGAAVVGIERDTTAACALPGPLDAGVPDGGTRQMIHTAGVSEVPNDPQRIVEQYTTSVDCGW
ncbi:transporter, partial [Rhodococcus sp. CC-R104]|nr:transporter [Rhodococcus sp. CC-R104]